MADTKVSALTQLAEVPAATDEFELVDKSDTTDAASGTNKRIQAQHLLPLGVKRLIWRGGTRISTAAGTANHMLGPTADSVVTLAGNQLLIGAANTWFYLLAADYALTGYTTRITLRGHVVTGTTAPAINYTFALNPLSVGSNAFALGTLVMSGAINTPAANAITTGSDLAANFPADGAYIVRCTTSGTPSGNATVAAAVYASYIPA